MKSLVIFDSLYGQTERIARAIAGVLAESGSAQVEKASDIATIEVAGVDLVLIGGPTQLHGLSPAMRDFLERMPAKALQGLKVGAFDTRRRMNAFLTGSAAGSIAGKVRRLGAQLVAGPESFFVIDSKVEGADTATDAPNVHVVQRERKGKPAKVTVRTTYLEQGEEERAAAWARTVVDRLKA